MKKYLSNILIVLLALLGTALPLAAQDVDRIEAEKRIKKLFQDYEYYGTFVESFNDEQVSETMITQFRNLFGASAMVNNDIKQSDNYGKKVTLESYINDIKTWYPSGLSVSLSPPQLGNITCNKGKCQVVVPTVKSMGGLTKEGKDYRDTEILANFVVSFDATLQNCKIVEIRGTEEEFAQTTTNKPDKKTKKEPKSPTTEPIAKVDKPKVDKPKVDKPNGDKVKTVKVKPVKSENVFAKGNNEKAKRTIVGLYLGAGWTWSGGLGDFSPLTGGNAEKLSDVDAKFAEDFSTGTRPLSYQSVLGLNRFGLTYQQYMGEKFGFTLGLGFHTYQSIIQGDLVNQTYLVNNTEIGSKEPDNTGFNRTFEAKSFKENYSYSNLSLLLGVQYQAYSYVRDNNFRPFLKGGLELSVVSLGHSVNFEGNINSTATYTQGATTFEFVHDNATTNASKIYNDIYWLYDDATVVGNRKPQQELVAKATALNISPTIEGGFDWMLGKSGKWCVSAAAQLSLGALPLFGTSDATIYGNNNILLKRQYTATNSSSDTYYAYTPLEIDSYEYRSIHGADESISSQFLGFTFGIKYILKKGVK